MSNGVGGDNIPAIDASLTSIITGDLNLVASIQAQLASLVSSPKPTYTISGPTGSQNVSWESYQLMLMQQLDSAERRLQQWFRLKQTNMPFFNVRQGR